MDIRSAAHYMNVGYRVRRSSWDTDSYMKLDTCGELIQFHRMVSYTIGPDENGVPRSVKHSYMSGGPTFITVEEILAEDWEVITAGIRKEFSKHEHGMEYDDDTDWDNYIPPKGVWFNGDEDE